MFQTFFFTNSVPQFVYSYLFRHYAEQYGNINTTTTSGVLLKMEVGIRKGAWQRAEVPCLFMITEVSIRCQNKPGGWYTAYTPQYTTDYN